MVEDGAVLPLVTLCQQSQDTKILTDATGALANLALVVGNKRHAKLLIIC